jgi:iron complex transport system permease protein
MTTASLAGDTRSLRWSPRSTVVGLHLVLWVVIILSLGLGALRLSPAEVIAILLRPLGIDLPWGRDAQAEAVVWAIRLPRIVLGGLAGAALASSGAALQGVFRNPLADPVLIGVSSGASAGAVTLLVAGAHLASGLSRQAQPFALPVAAFAGGLLATFMVLQVTRLSGRSGVAVMLLAGIAINALFSAVTGLLMFVAGDQALRSIIFWLLGSVGGATWPVVTGVAPLLLLCVLVLPRWAGALNLVLLGEAEAWHSGIDVERVKRRVIVLCALGVGAAVSACGVIGFLGLIAPHLARLVLGPDHRSLLRATVPLGACLLLGADLIARTVVAPAELPIGAVTALLGAPWFLWLLIRDRGAAA